MSNDLQKRLFEFAVRTIEYVRLLPDTTEYKVIKYQLVKSSTSSGANYEESQAGVSRADFNNKVKIALKEMKESNYWYRIIKAITKKGIPFDELEWLINESKELGNILGSIAQKTRKDK